MRTPYRWIAGAAVLWLAGCASDQPAPVVDLSMPSSAPSPPPGVSENAAGSYRVVRGDTLYAIAFKHGLDYRDLAAWNGIGAPYRILVGQELRLSAPAQPLRSQPGSVVEATPATPPPPSGAEPKPGEAVTSAVSEGAAAPPPASSGFQPIEGTPASPSVPATPPSVEQTLPPVATATADAEQKQPMPTPHVETPAKTAPPAPGQIGTEHSSAPSVLKPEPVAELNAGGVTWRWPSDGKVIAAYVSGDPTRQGIDVGGQAGDPVRAAADGEVVYSGNGLIGYGELIIVKHNASFLSAYGHNRKRLVSEGTKVKAGQPIAEMGSSASARDELHFEIRRNGKPVNPLEYLPAR